MTDSAFQKLLLRLAKANAKYKELLEQAEEEYNDRYGCFPSDHDNDQWIDSFCTGTGYMTVEEVKSSAKTHNETKSRFR